MKRKLIGLLCACMLLSACGNSSSSSLETLPPETQAAAIPLLDQGAALEESSNLLYIPNPAMEDMVVPEMRLLGNGLLFSQWRENAMVLRHISLEDGSMLASASLPAGDGTRLTIGSGEIGLCDRETGRVSILDEKFQPLRSYDVPREGDDWYLNSELDTLYVFYYNWGLKVYDLETGKEFWLVENGFRVESMGSSTGYVLFAYTNREDQKTYTRCLNLSTAILETLPVEGPVSDVVRQGDTWLLRDGENHTLVRGENLRSFLWEDSPVQLLPLRRHLLLTDPSGRTLTLYENDGTFLSRCTLPMSSSAMVGPDFVWSGYWDGYFFVDYLDGVSRLMFWDVNSGSKDEDLPLSAPGEPQQVQPVLEAQLYERAAELSQRFGVEIRIGEQCSLDYSHYDTFAVNDPIYIRAALDVLETGMSQYPEGFFRQLTYGSIESIQIDLVGSIWKKADVESHPNSVKAFVTDRGSHYIMVMDSFMANEKTLFHEFSHIIDDRLAWDSLIREGAKYSEEAWLALQPEGFHYAESYIQTPEELNAFLEAGFFISEYAMTNSTEDRAVLIATAMVQKAEYFEENTYNRAKMQFYADCIRECFDTEGWPEVTLWEQVLQ